MITEVNNRPGPRMGWKSHRKKNINMYQGGVKIKSLKKLRYNGRFYEYE
jgi:hypothetical protein